MCMCLCLYVIYFTIKLNLIYVLDTQEVWFSSRAALHCKTTLISVKLFLMHINLIGNYCFLFIQINTSTHTSGFIHAVIYVHVPAYSNIITKTVYKAIYVYCVCVWPCLSTFALLCFLEDYPKILFKLAARKFQFSTKPKAKLRQ